ncbi:hypothetical protein LXA43DRAFT_1059670 [Ganoderma leucocontextum]|nr:hypothetical protein LXA43DRAFT_1059670 [Ganoderma leucocontextum]
MLSLPNELIALLLVRLSEGLEIDESSWPLRNSSRAWLPLAQTCHRVHEVAVSTQHLWRCIAVFTTGGFDTALGRSGDLEIDVIFHRPHIIPSAFMLLATHAARVRMLVVIEADRDTHSALRFLLARPMPALKTCQVHLVHRDILQHRHGEMRFAVDHALVPNLRTLQLGILRLDWKSATIPRLRRLSLCNSFPRTFLTFDRFLDVLQSCAALEYLKIVRSPPFMTPVPSTERTVALPNLRTLILESSDYTEVSALLAHLQLSEHIDLDINLDIDTDIEEEAVLTIPDILPIDPTRLPLLASATSASLTSDSAVLIECIGPGRLQAFLNPASATETDQGWHYTPSQAVAHFCALLAHAPLRALELGLAWPYAGETCAASGMFAHVFQAFSALEELAYGGGANEASDRQLLGAFAGVALPRLRVLQLREWNGELVPFLVQVLQMRMTRGLRLSQLDIQLAPGSEGVPDMGLRALRQLVDGDVTVRY